MKKVSFIVSVTALLLSGCGCLIAQIPPQTIYVDESCQVELPNYLDNVTVTDNCSLDTIYQYPETGYILNADNQSVMVTITAIDDFGNQTDMSFEVTAVDTVGPVIEPDSTLSESVWYQYKRNLVTELHQAVLRDLKYVDQHMEYSSREQILESTGDSILYQDWYDNTLAIFCPSAGEGIYSAVFYPDSVQVCACDTVTGNQVGEIYSSF
jgi:hypothetical protein